MINNAKRMAFIDFLLQRHIAADGRGSGNNATRPNSGGKLGKFSSKPLSC